MADFDVDEGTKRLAFTNKNYRNVYPAIDPTRPELSQKGKIVVITGATRGLGRLSFVASFAQAGAAAIVLIGRSEAGLIETEKLVREINPEIEVLRFALSVTNETSVNNAFKEIVAQVGVPNVLINNAGNLAPLLSTVESSLDSWWECHEVNIRGTFLVTKAFITATGATPSAPTTIISLTSTASLGTAPGMGAYSMSKLAISKLMAFIASEHPAITAVALDPGIVATEMGHSVPFLAPFLNDTPELVGGSGVWLASGDKNYLSGRYVAANWDVEEIERRKDEIVSDNQLTIFIKAKFANYDDVTVQY